MLPSLLDDVRRLRLGVGRGAHLRRRRLVTVQRLTDTINGREYTIEVSRVGSDKWRAQIARLPGGSAALMPFYGSTPGEAAGHLSRWLAIAHGVKSPGTPRATGAVDCLTLDV